MEPPVDRGRVVGRKAPSSREFRPRPSSELAVGEKMEMYKVTVEFIMHMESHDVSAAWHRQSLIQSKSASHLAAGAWCRERGKERRRRNKTPNKHRSPFALITLHLRNYNAV